MNAAISTASIAHFIHGQRVAGNSLRTQPVTNPATGTVTGAVALANRADVDAAVASAAAAFPAWTTKPNPRCTLPVTTTAASCPVANAWRCGVPPTCTPVVAWKT